MDTKYLTTKYTKKKQGRVGTTNGHEWTRIAKELFNHETHEKHEKNAQPSHNLTAV